jgi:peptide/nickel transport system substrate-binding protein
MPTSRLLARAATVVTFALASTTCGGGAPGATSGTPPPSATASQINAMPRDKVQDGGKLTLALTGMPPNFNYNQIDNTLDGYWVLGALMPTPYLNDASSAPIWNRDILASEPKLTTEPKQVVTYEINPKAI